MENSFAIAFPHPSTSPSNATQFALLDKSGKMSAEQEENNMNDWLAVGNGLLVGIFVALLICIGLLVVLLRRGHGGAGDPPGIKDLREGQERAEDLLRKEMKSNREETLSNFDKLRDSMDKRLSDMHTGIGAMQDLAANVGNLQRVLTNVRTRGVFGETQLERLLQQTLTQGQWERQTRINPSSSEIVDFAIRLPGAEGDDGNPVWLPVDAKFPLADYERLLQAQERDDTSEMEAASKSLEGHMKSYARDIRRKYIAPPHTTDFAMIFLPNEGIFAEALRRPDLVENLQREHRVTIVGPTTVLAMLNSLQMGFSTLAIQKRSAEVWKILGDLKSEFGQFGDLLDKIIKKLNEALKIADGALPKIRNIERRLDKVQELPQAAGGHSADGG